MPDLLNRYRQTGRTSRLLEQAIELAWNGEPVLIITANASETERLLHILDSQLAPDPVCRGSIQVIDYLHAAEKYGYSFSTGCLSYRVLVDNFTIEQHFGHLIYQWELWNHEAKRKSKHIYNEPPVIPVDGDIYYDEKLQALRIYTGTCWVNMVVEGIFQGQEDMKKSPSSLDRFTNLIEEKK